MKPVSALCAAVLLSAGFAQASQVELVSKRHPSFNASEVVGEGREVDVSADGRWIAFTSTSPNLVPGQSDGNAYPDVFLLDRLSGDLTLLSQAAGFPNTTGVGYSSGPSISADGRYVVFASGSNNLVPGQASPLFSSDNVFLYDRIDGSLTLISHADGSVTAGGNGRSSGGRISKDGSTIVFWSAATNLIPGVADTNGKDDIFLYDRAAGTLALVSRSASSAGTAANGQSLFPVLSADGRYVLYGSEATDLVSGQTDTNLSFDVFLYDRDSGTNTLVSHAAGLPSKAGNTSSSASTSSDDGAYVVFTSGATDLVAGQADSVSTWSDAFLWERATGTVTLLSHPAGAPATAAGGQRVSMSADGAWIAFESAGTDLVPGQIDTNGAEDVFLVQRATGAVTLVSRQSGTAATTGNATHMVGSFSGDGRYLLFGSSSTDLVAGQTDTNGAYDVFLFDRVAGTTVLASHADGSSTTAGDGESLPGRLSADGSHAVYLSQAMDLTDAATNGKPQLFVFSRQAGSNAGILGEPVVRVTPNDFSRGFPSRDGRFAVLWSQATDLVEDQLDAADTVDVFLVDRLAGTTTLVSHAAGTPARAANRDSSSPWISGDGKWIVFESDATDLIPGTGLPSGFPRYNVYLYGRESGTLTLVSHRASDPNLSANGFSTRQMISGDGRYVAFSSMASNLVAGQIDTTGPGGPDVFLYDRVTGGISLASHAPGNPLQAVNVPGSNPPPVGISYDGRYVLFPSPSAGLVAGQVEGNSGNDLFLYDRVTGAVTLVSRSAASPTATANATTDLPLLSLSADGRFVAFVTAATDVVPGQVDTNGAPDLFLFDRVAGTATLVSRKSGAGATTGNGWCHNIHWLSDDGRYLAFSSWATDLVPGQIDLNQGLDAFLYDRLTGTVSLLTPDGVSTDPAATTFAYGLSPDGRFVAISSQETLRIPGQADQNGHGADLFVLDRLAGTTRLASRSRVSPLTTGNHFAGISWFAGGGHLLFFHSAASDLVDGDWNQESDTYVYSPGSAPASDYFTLTPCRVADTRATGSLASGAAVLFDLHGVCGIPATARAVALNVTVTQGSGPGSVTLYPGDAEPPLASAVSFRAGQTRANNAVLALAYDGSGTLTALPSMTGGGTVHLILDVVGWFE